MSKETETEKLSDDGLDDLDLDLGGDFGEDIGVSPESQDRGAVSALSHGFADGVKSELTDPNKVVRRIKRALPEEYESTFDTVDTVASTAGELYNTALNESKAGIRDFKKSANKIFKANEDKVPEFIRKRLGKLLEVEDEYKGPSQDQIREDSITSGLSSIFGEQAETQNQLENRREARDTVRELAANKRHLDQTGQLALINQNIQRQVSYQDKVTARYQRKSLELSYRQLFVSKDIYTVMSAYSRDSKEALQAVVKNTSLPEYRKIQLSEASGQMVRDAVLGKVQGRAVDFGRNFIVRTKDRLAAKTKETAANFGDQLSQFAGMMDQTSEMGDMGVDAREVGGSALGGILGEVFGRKAINRIRARLEKNPELVATGSRLAAKMDSLPRLTNDWLREDREGIMGRVTEALRETIGIESIDRAMVGQGHQFGSEPAIYDKQTRRSIIEIIPGYLSRIHSEVQGVRIGMGFEVNDRDRLKFDIVKGKFSTAGGTKKTIKKRIFSDSNMEFATDSIYNLIDTIDSDKSLSPEATRALGEKLLKDHYELKSFDVNKLMDGGVYGEGVSDKARKEITAAIQKSFGLENVVDEKTGQSSYKVNKGLETSKRYKDATLGFNSLSATALDPKEQIKAFMEMGNYDELMALGLIKFNPIRHEFELNYEKVYDYYLNGGERFNAFEQEQRKKEAHQQSNPNQFKSFSSFVGPMPQSRGVGALHQRAMAEGQKLYQEHVPENIRSRISGGITSLESGYQSVANDVRENGAKATLNSLYNQGKEKALDKYQSISGEAQRLYEGKVPENVRVRISANADSVEKEYREIAGEIESKGLKATIEGLARRLKNGAKGKFQGSKAEELYNQGGGYLNQAQMSLAERGVDVGSIKNRFQNFSMPSFNGVPKTKEEAKEAINGLLANAKELAKKKGLDRDFSQFFKRDFGFGAVPEASGATYSNFTYGKQTTGGNEVYRRSVNPMMGEPLSVDDVASGVENDDIVKKDKPTPLSAYLVEIRDSLNGSSEGVTTEVQKLTAGLTDKGMNPDEAQITLLGSILENVSAIGQMLAKDDKESWFNILHLGKKTGRAMAKVGGSLGSFYLGGLKMLGGAFGGAGQMASGLGRGLGRSINNLFSSKNKIGAVDVYVKNNPEPILTGRNLSKGKYYDSLTNTQIKSVEDLKELQGDIIEYDGKEPRVVATASMLRGGIYDRFGHRLGSSGLLNKLKYSAKGVGNYATAPSRMLFKAGAKSLEGVKNFIDRPRDIYVKGEESPRILANVMKNGGYISAVTSHPIYSFKDIDGDVLDRQGNVVLSLDEMRRGLVDKDGRPLGFLNRQLSRLGSLVGMGKRAMGMASRLLKKGGKRGIQFGRELSGGVKNTVKGGFDGLLVAGGEELKSQTSLLTQIRDILDNRLEKINKLDTDGDGFRENGWRERLYSKKDKAGANGQSKIAERLARKTKNNFKTTINNSDGSDSSGMDAATSGMMGAAGAWLAGKGKGLVGMLKGGAGKALKFAAGTGGLLVRGGAMVAGAAAGLISLPALAVGALAAGVAAGGYMLYKHLTKLTKGDFTKLRLAQYGVGFDDDDTIAKILYLEDKLYKHAVVKNGEVKINLKEVDEIDLAKGFGVNLDDVPETQRYAKWFVHRFIPVFSAHVGAVKTISNNMELKDVDDDIEPKDTSTFLTWVKRVSDFQVEGVNPYMVFSSPFPGEITITPEKIGSMISNLVAKYHVVDPAKDGKETDKEKPSVRSAVENRKTRQLKSETPKALSDKVISIDQVRRSREANSNTRQFVQRQNANMHGYVPYTGGEPVPHPGSGKAGDINQLPLPNGDGSWSAHKDLIVAAANMAGVDPGIMATMAGIESGFNSKAKAGTSSATGLFQFIDGTWRKMLNKYAGKYGISKNASPLDPRANALMGAEYIKENSKALERVLGREATDTDLYLAHFLGASGASKFLASNPGESAVRAMPRAAQANPSIFRDGGRARTLGGVYQLLDQKVSRMRNRFAGDARSHVVELGHVPSTLASDDDPQSSSTVVASNGTGSIRDRIKNPASTSPVSTGRVADLSVVKPAQKSGFMKTSVSIDNSNAIREISKGDISSIERRNNQVQQARLLDLQNKRNNEEMSKDMGRLVDILTNSLFTQQSMDDKLSIISDLLRNNQNKDAGTPPPQEQPKVAQGGAVRANSTEMSQTVVKLNRARVI